MRTAGLKILGLLFLIIFSLGILIEGKYSPASTKMVTIHIDGIKDETVAERVQEVVCMIEGIQTVFVDVNSSLCTFRYDSGKTNLDQVRSQLAGLGLRMMPVKSVRILDSIKESSRQKLISIQVNSPN